MSKEKQESNIRIFRGFAQLLALSFDLTKKDDDGENSDEGNNEQDISYYY